MNEPFRCYIVMSSLIGWAHTQNGPIRGPFSVRTMMYVLFRIRFHWSGGIIHNGRFYNNYNCMTDNNVIIYTCILYIYGYQNARAFDVFLR